MGSVLEAAKLAGMRTGLVSTTAITHATPGCKSNDPSNHSNIWPYQRHKLTKVAYSAHTPDRNNQNLIAEQQLGKIHPLGPVVDVLLGGGRCNFLPKNQTGSCREDNTDLYAYAKEKGWSIARDRDEFDEFELGKGEARLPILGNFADGTYNNILSTLLIILLTPSGDMRLEIDRRELQDQPSLLEMSQTAVHALHRATHCREKGYFLMIESAKLDTSGHAGDVPAHAVGTWHYNEVMEWLSEWIDEHPDTILISSADHETGGLSLSNNYNPVRAYEAKHTANYLAQLWADRPSNANDVQFLKSEILSQYALSDATTSEIEALLATDDMESGLADLLSERVGAFWSTGGHSAIDVTLFGYAAGEKSRELKADLARSWDNTELPRYIEDVLGLDMDAVTKILQEAADEDDSWMGSRQD